ncbi:acid sphingomyelinase-like phosphodiesterase 3a isoform X1 [Osmerus eperlanus]|uniref:acid sphingomyelinase-like phosphodiesterase 3a n=2 Tax=Osmerus TaxID=8013 RepID=UPI002E142AFD
MGFVSCLSLFGLQLYFVNAAPVEPLETAHLRGVGKFWHVSDLHLDPTYHLTEDPTKVCFSSKGVPASHPGLFGDFMCDSPYQLIQSAFTHIREAGQQAQFMIWTGDSPPHVPAGELSTDMVVQVISNMTQTIRHYFPDLPVYPALGNHDYWPQDQYPTSTNAIYQAAAKLWQPWLKPSSLQTLREGGFYSQLVQSGLRLVSLNTNLYYSPNKQTLNTTDPSGQLQWLQETLEGSVQAREKVFVIAHVPVGYLPWARDTTAIREIHNEQLVSIFRKYSDIIAGQFYGHTHRDSIMVLQDEQGKPVNSLFVSPAVTPIKSVSEPYSNNPGFRMYLYHPQDYTLLDVWQYYLNLTEANQSQRSDWKLEYSLREAFDLKDLQPESLFQLASSFQDQPSKTFPKYFTHFMVSYNSSIECEDDCKLTQLCAVLYLDQDSYSKCIKQGK